ncbi:MAG: hypothetical protein AAB638_02760 [Patescibacteria group bacterium]
MLEDVEKLSKILGTTPEELSLVDEKMSKLSGKTGVLDSVAQSNQHLVDKALMDLDLSRESSAEEVYDALTQKLIDIDKNLFELLGKPDLSKLSTDAGKVRDVALSIFTPPKGLFIKKEKVVELLEKQPPQSLLEHFGYQNVSELIEKEGFASVVSALRFTQSTEWMHQFFDTAYEGLKPEDFEERDVEIKILDSKWLEIAQKFIGKKFHNVSHLKEFGIIFISPDPIDMPGETLRMFVLLLHYLHEVPFYSGLFRKFLNDSDFVAKLQSLLRGDVPEGPTPKEGNSWRIVQRYLAKDDPADFRLHEHHVDPEAEHWYRVAQNFSKLAEVMGDNVKFNISYWTGLNHVGDFFPSASSGQAVLVSFDVVDLIMSLVKRGEVKYLYHQQEAMWNYIFSEYVGRDTMNTLTEENIIKGFIEL